MKRFLIHTTITLAALLAIMSTLDIVMTRNLHCSDANMLRGMNDAFFDSTHYDVVIMGSSRGLRHYDTRVFDSILHLKTYNLSIDGRGIISQIIKYKAFEKRHGHPKLIIQNIDCFALGNDDGYEREQYLPYLFDKDLFNMTKKWEGFSYADRFIPLIRYAGYTQMIKEGLGLKNKMVKSTLYSGYSPCYDSWNGTVFESVEEVWFSNSPESVDILEKHLQSCNDEGIKVLFVYSPMYIGAQKKMKDKTIQEMYDTYNNIAQKHGVEILSWWDSTICEDTNNFYNATHLNITGARLFSTELAQHIENTYVRKCY